MRARIRIATIPPVPKIVKASIGSQPFSDSRSTRKLQRRRGWLPTGLQPRTTAGKRGVVYLRLRPKHHACTNVTKSTLAPSTPAGISASPDHARRLLTHEEPKTRGMAVGNSGVFIRESCGVPPRDASLPQAGSNPDFRGRGSYLPSWWFPLPLEIEAMDQTGLEPLHGFQPRISIRSLLRTGSSSLPLSRSPDAPHHAWAQVHGGDQHQQAATVCAPTIGDSAVRATELRRDGSTSPA